MSNSDYQIRPITREEWLPDRCMPATEPLDPGAALVTHSLDWGKENGWQRFEIHFALPGVGRTFKNEQKSCRAFWSRFGFEVFRTEEASQQTKAADGVDVRYSMALDLGRW